jgi:FkbM family methyltransferase
MSRLLKKFRSVYLRWKYGGIPTIAQTDFLGCKLLVRADEDVGRSIILDNFEIADLTYFQDQVLDGDVVFDIGANTGAYCIPLSMVPKRVNVHAFEPIPINVQILKLSIMLNKVKNISLIEKCVSRESGEVSFSLSEDSAYSSMIDTGRKAEIEVLKCQSISLDEYCKEAKIPRVDLMKVDVEGAEELVISGATSLFSDAKRKPRLVLMELYDQNLNAFSTSIEKILLIMNDYCYSPYILDYSGLIEFEPRHHNKNYNVFFRLSAEND